jgi:hypothetical protein
MSLPPDWMNNASAGQKMMLGVWSSIGIAAGTAGYFRLYDNGFTQCHMQGTVSGAGGGGDMILDNINIAIGQTVTVNSFILTSGNS